MATEEQKAELKKTVDVVKKEIETLSSVEQI
jgi:hypothetical protein